MGEYVLGHHLKGEGKRLALMSQLLDPMLVRLATDRRICLLGAFTFASIREQSYRRDACTTLSIL